MDQRAIDQVHDAITKYCESRNIGPADRTRVTEMLLISVLQAHYKDADAPMILERAFKLLAQMEQ
ncbi:MAG TPA: hypothetical protein VGJ20_00090 [Xanthobacteraceae bacterium]|jgi:hypothetical protein